MAFSLDYLAKIELSQNQFERTYNAATGSASGIAIEMWTFNASAAGANNSTAQTGVKSGVPDIQVAIPSNGCHGLFIEFKSKGGSVTQIQKNMHDKLKDAGYRVEVVYDWFEARIILSEYIRGTKYDRPSAVKGMYNKTGSCGS